MRPFCLIFMKVFSFFYSLPVYQKNGYRHSSQVPALPPLLKKCHTNLITTVLHVYSLWLLWNTAFTNLGSIFIDLKNFAACFLSIQLCLLAFLSLCLFIRVYLWLIFLCTHEILQKLIWVSTFFARSRCFKRYTQNGKLWSCCSWMFTRISHTGPVRSNERIRTYE